MTAEFACSVTDLFDNNCRQISEDKTQNLIHGGAWRLGLLVSCKGACLEGSIVTSGKQLCDALNDDREAMLQLLLEFVVQVTWEVTLHSL